MSDHPFVYDNLEDSSREHRIRLLKIHEGDIAQELKCSLETHDYNDCPEFVALSYTWGPETPTRTIWVNGQRQQIRKNLSVFMKTFRHSWDEKDLLLWIDQICIDQKNIQERNSQVRRMGDIFSRARYVIAWLGLGNDLDQAVMRDTAQVNVNESSATWREEVGPITFELLRGYHSVISKPYFERLWIVQEIFQAKELWMTLGDGIGGTMAVRWDLFSKAFVLLMSEIDITSRTTSAAREELLLRQAIRDHGIIYQLWEAKRASKKIDLFYLIEAFSRLKCADPRDKLYALGDIGFQEHRLFTIDYGQEPFFIFCDFLEACMDLIRSDQLNDRQIDSVATLAREMGVVVEYVDETDRTSEWYKGHDPTKDTLFSLERQERLRELFEKSYNYLNSTNVQLFGPRYDEKSGRRLPVDNKLGMIVNTFPPQIFVIPESMDVADLKLSFRADKQQEDKLVSLKEHVWISTRKDMIVCISPTRYVRRQL